MSLCVNDKELLTYLTISWYTLMCEQWIGSKVTQIRFSRIFTSLIQQHKETEDIVYFHGVVWMKEMYMYVYAPVSSCVNIGICYSIYNTCFVKSYQMELFRMN